MNRKFITKCIASALCFSFAFFMFATSSLTVKAADESTEVIESNLTIDESAVEVVEDGDSVAIIAEQEEISITEIEVIETADFSVYLIMMIAISTMGLVVWSYKVPKTNI